MQKNRRNYKINGGNTMKRKNEELQLSDYQKYIDKLEKKIVNQDYKTVARSQINSRKISNRSLNFMYIWHIRRKIGG